MERSDLLYEGTDLGLDREGLEAASCSCYELVRLV